MENKQTAVEWLYEKINSNLSAPMSAKFKEMFEQAKQIEKEQIMESFEDGATIYDGYQSSEHYYKETYEK